MAIVNTVLTGFGLFSDLGIAPSIVQNPRGDEPAFLNTAWTIQLFRGLTLFVLASIVAGPVAEYYELPELAPLLRASALMGLIGGLASTKIETAERHLKLGEVEPAVAQLRKAARIDRTDFESTRQLAFALRSVGDGSGQIDEQERARDLNPGDPAAHRRLAWAYYDNRRYADADAAFVRALRLDPGDADSYLGRANVQLQEHRPGEADQPNSLGQFEPILPLDRQ